MGIYFSAWIQTWIGQFVVIKLRSIGYTFGFVKTVPVELMIPDKTMEHFRSNTEM